MATQRFAFDDAALAAIAPPPGGQQLRVFDTELAGLGLWIGASGQKVFFAFRWAPGMARPEEKKLGPFPQLSVDEARRRAPGAIAELVAAAEEAALTPGECRQCLDMTMLDGRGLCQKCRPLPPCVRHPDTTSTARCVSCNRAHCDACLTARRCAECANKPAKRKKGAPGPADAAPAKPAKGAGAPRQKLMVGVGAALVLVLAGVLAWQAIESADPPATDEQRYAQRLGLATSGIDAYKAEKKQLPPDARALAAFMKANNITGATLAAPGASAKDAVVYERRGDDYALFATDAEGKRLEGEGAPARPRRD